MATGTTGTMLTYELGLAVHLRVATLPNIPIACNRASADHLVSSPLLSSGYRAPRPDHVGDRDRRLAS